MRSDAALLNTILSLLVSSFHL